MTHRSDENRPSPPADIRIIWSDISGCTIYRKGLLFRTKGFPRWIFIPEEAVPDGTEIYKSGMVAPGAVIDCLRLRAVPVAGVYENTILKYSCWNVGDDGELSEVNGANTLFTLEVIP